MVLLRGDHEANELKIKKTLGVNKLEMASDELLRKITGSPPGYAGPVGLQSDCEIVADLALNNGDTYVAGANKKDTHIKNLELSRDVKSAKFMDLRNAEEQDSCPKCEKGKFKYVRGIEVGHIFMLGDIYSKKMKATFLNQNGQSNPFVMGCYGIGIGRTVAAAIEQCHDEKGIVWPYALAPYLVDVIVTNIKDENLVKSAETLYEKLWDKKIETILDNRNETVGVKFKDAELIGFPFQVVVGKKFVESGLVELKLRKTGEVELLDMDAVVNKIFNLACK